MNTSQEAAQPLMPQHPTVTASTPLSPRQMTSLGLANWPFFKYDGFLTTRQAWPASALVAQDAHPPPLATATCGSTSTVDCEAPTGNCAPATSVEVPTPEVTKELSQSEKLAQVFASTPKQPFEFSFHPGGHHHPTSRTPVQTPETPAAAPLTLPPPEPGRKPRTSPARRTPPPAAVPASEESPYDRMKVFPRDGFRSRDLARGAARMAELGDRIVLYTDGSAKRGRSRGVPRTAAVTYQLLYGGSADARAAPWHDRAYGILGVRGAHEAEVVAVAEALGAVEQEVRAYVQGRAAHAAAAAAPPRLLVLLFSDSDYCLGVLDKMLVAMRAQKPFTGRDSTVGQLEADLRRLGEYLRSTDLPVHLEFRCIKSHSEIEGNDRADALATEAFPVARWYFSGRQRPSTGTQHEVADMDEMTKGLKAWRQRGSAAYSTDESTTSSRSVADRSLSETDKPRVGTDCVESLMEARKAEEKLLRASGKLPAAESTKPEGQPQVPDAGEHAASPPLSDVYQMIADFQRESRKQRIQDRRQNGKTALKTLEAVEELTRTSHVATTTTLVDMHEVAESKPERKKQRKRDVLFATIRRAGKRLRGLGRESKSV